jgi:hypothetical protein
MNVTREKHGPMIEFRIPDHAESPVLVLVFNDFSSGAAMRAAVNKWAKPYGATLAD